MTSKYAIALYELVQLRAGLQKCVETFPIDHFRELMGVPPGKLLRGPDFERRVLDIATLEVNGLSDVGVELQPVRKGSRAPITAITVAWWRKQGEEYRATLRELQQPKIGRLARLKGTVEHVVPAPPPITAEKHERWQAACRAWNDGGCQGPRPRLSDYD
jgi:plasmid replication initiation protein